MKNPTPFQCYATDEMDGSVTSRLCDGMFHVERTNYAFSSGYDVHLKGRCDHSCEASARQVDLRMEMATMIKDSNAGFGCRVKMDAGSALLVLANTPIIGTCFHTFYGKRSDKGKVVCLGEQHVWLSTRAEWREGLMEYDDIHRLSVYECDSSCKPKHVSLSRKQKRKLREL